jgi:hypothetical protein
VSGKLVIVNGGESAAPKPHVVIVVPDNYDLKTFRLQPQMVNACTLEIRTLSEQLKIEQHQKNSNGSEKKPN